MRIDGKKLATNLISELKKDSDMLRENGIIPTLAIIHAGKNSSSDSYIKQKKIKGKEAGIRIKIYKVKKNSSLRTLNSLIYKLNNESSIHGIIVQRPLFEHFISDQINYSVLPEKDVDGFHGESEFDPPVALAVFNIINSVINKDKFDKNKILIVGKGETAGKPIYRFLKKKKLSPHIADSKSDLGSACKEMDIIISAVGKKVIAPQFLKKGVVLIGVGMRKDEKGKLRGDYDENEIQQKASYYTPTPGGVGPLNVAYLLKNVLKAARL